MFHNKCLRPSITWPSVFLPCFIIFLSSIFCLSSLSPLWGAGKPADCSWMKENTWRRFGIIGVIRPTGGIDWKICLSDDSGVQVWGGQWSIYSIQAHWAPAFPREEGTRKHCCYLCKNNGASVTQWENKWTILMLTQVGLWLVVNNIMNKQQLKNILFSSFLFFEE